MLIAVLVLLFYVLPLAAAGYEMLSIINREWEGVIYGVLFGPIGLVLAWAIRANALARREDALRQQAVVRG